MLKWTVINKRAAAAETTEHRRHLAAGTCTDVEKFREKPKRRRSSSTSRRCSASRRSGQHNRHSLNLDFDKENHCTSTPIKADEHFQALRDVSNITPKDTFSRMAKPALDENKRLVRNVKKKKRCLDPEHNREDFLRSRKLLADERNASPSENSSTPNRLDDQKPSTYASTLPNFELPAPHNFFNNRSRVPPIFSHIILDDNCPPHKKAKIDHVSDFLHQISHFASPEDKRMRFHGLVSSARKARIPIGEVKVSPLVKKLVDLRFSKMSCGKEDDRGPNNSSHINDLSLDDLVDAILDSSNEVDGHVDDHVEDNTSIKVNIDSETRLQERENELNESQEENLVNVEQERQTYLIRSFSERNSTDSGFRSTSTVQSHHIDSNFLCQCNNNNNNNSRTKVVPNNFCSEINCDKTIINLEETFNERCVDVEVDDGRKRTSATPNNSSGGKRLHLEDLHKNNTNFTLKRQKCIRRRKLTDTDDGASKQKKMSENPNWKIFSPEARSFFSEPDENCINDNSFDSSISDRANDPEVASDTPSSQRNLGNTVIMETPTENFHNIRRTRRCLSFQSPESDYSNSPSDKQEVSGTLELSVEHNPGELIINVVRCKDLYRPNGTIINAYVKVSLSERVGDGRRKQQGTLQRTAVQAESFRPIFNHTFKLALQKADLHKRLYIEVWHRDRICRRSEFLGCMSFAVKNAIKKSINGTFRLLPQSTGRCQNAPITTDRAHSSNSQLFQDVENAAAMCESQYSVEEIITIDDFDSDLRKNANKAILSQQQKDADENLFLRYLELDPTEGPEAIPAAMQRKATGNKNGKTPFTTTKKLMRPPKSGFGFSVVWTHPPRIERVEKGLPADKAGILPGDYIIFVDKHNVVMMPEIDILNLIRSYGNQLTLEIFRRNSARNGSVPSVPHLTSAESASGLPPPSLSTQRRPSTICSTTNTTSVDYSRRRLHLPQVTFSAEKPTNSPEDARKKAMYQLISKEQQYATGLQFGVTRFVSSLAERRDLISPAEHRILFQNSEELLRITEDILDTLVPEDGEPQVHLLPRTYHSKLGEIISAYKKYCSGIKKSDYVLANKAKNSNSDFVRFLQVPAIPRRRPDITVFIHKPLEHFREVLKLFNVILSNMKPKNDEYPVISQIVHDLQITYREITSEGGLMEPIGEGRPLLSVQDLENRLVFTKCKPFVLSKPGRHWIFGGDLSRVEGRNVRQYWALLFSDILLFAKVSRDRVLFIMEDPLSLAHITDLTFNVRKKVNEFRITVEPGGRTASSPTVHCGPDLTRTPRKNPNKRCLVLRAPTAELKAVWQNLLQRQIFHVNAGMDGSSFSSPLESPEAPITSSVATLQSAESLSLRRQTPQFVNHSEKPDSQKQLTELIEHKCKQLGKSSCSKNSAIHLEQWMKGQLGSDQTETPEEESDIEVWSEEMFQKRCEELRLTDVHGKTSFKVEAKRCESRWEEVQIFEDLEQSPSRSTTPESQVTVRSSPVVPETMAVCRQCHTTCLTNENGAAYYSNYNSEDKNISTDAKDRNANNPRQTTDYSNNDEDWRPLMLMGLSAINPAATLVKLDPFAAPVPKISVVPPTPHFFHKFDRNGDKFKDTNCNCQNNRTEVNEIILNKENDISPDDSSPQTEEQPYHSLSSSNLTLRRYGTVSSLERVGSEENQEVESNEDSSNEGEGDNDEGDNDEDEHEEEEERGYDNEAFNHTSIRSWTARAGSFVAEKMAFFERLGEDYKTGSRFFERYLKTNEIQVNGDDGLEEETSGATSGEEVWGTPTSGGELDDTLSSPNYDGRRSPNEDSISSNDEDTELMMDELLMTPPVTSASIRGLLPRRTLEPLMEEEYSDTYTSSSSSSSSESAHTEPSVSPEQGNVTGNAADKCSAAAGARNTTKNSEKSGTPAAVSRCHSAAPKIHRSESYRHIIEAEDDNPTFFTCLKPTAKFINIERIPRSKGIKLLDFFNMKRAERRVHESFAGDRQLIKVFSKEGYFSDRVPTAYAEKPLSPRRMKDKQMDRRFWKQLSRRRGQQKPLQLSA